MRKIYFFSFLLVFYISINAQPQVVVHDPPTPYVTSDWGTDLQVITNMPEGKFSGIRRGPGDTLYVAMPDTNTIAGRSLLILRTTNNGANWTVVLSVQPAAVVEKVRMVISGLDSIYAIMRFGNPYNDQIYILRVTGAPLITQVFTGGYRDFDGWASSTGSLYLFLDSLGTNSIPRLASTNGGATWSQRAIVTSSGAHPFVERSAQGDTSILMYYQTTTGLTDTTTAAITTAKYRESAPGVLASGNFNTGLIPAGLPKDQFENATFGGITWVLYTEGAPGSRDIKFYLSTNGGANFTGPNNLAVTTVDEYFFDIKSYAYSPGGVDVVYFKDSAGATNSSDKLLYTNASTTTPTSFTAPEQISEHVPVADSKFITPELIEYYNATGDVAALWVGLNGTTPNVYFDRLSAVVGVENKNNEIPSAYKLEQNYPNPFNPKTVIEFSIPKNELVTLKLYDILGREVMTLLNKEMTAGSYKLDFDGTGISSGVYFYKLVSGDFTDTKKFILAK